ncbi:hypothetical protein VTN77DRAFT_8902 [Rasamsonia byssochlamydoides]|uniref:uncharacterized protein n=1 Tax=Rasamsonia byssochlamydoides TaxID=89139 RepID=UPI0037426A36
MASTSTRFSILIINPNTSTHMTNALKPIVENLHYPDVQFDYFTAPATPVTLPDGRVIHGIPSVDSGEDAARSALHCRPFVEPLIPKYDAFLVACYSAHPLVGMLKHTIHALESKARQDRSSSILGSLQRRKYVTGIFEASVATSLMLVSSFRLLDDWSHHKVQAADAFGIVTTGSAWKPELTKAVTEMIARPADKSSQTTSAVPTSVTTTRFAGVETTGLTAGQLHDTPPDEVRRRISDATEKLLKSSSLPVRAVCLGCAGMAGMQEAVREGCIKAYGAVEGQNVHIVDGVVAGIGLLVNACKAGF